jgi:hypothetical protein
MAGLPPYQIHNQSIINSINYKHQFKLHSKPPRPHRSPSPLPSVLWPDSHCTTMVSLMPSLRRK